MAWVPFSSIFNYQSLSVTHSLLVFVMLVHFMFMKLYSKPIGNASRVSRALPRLFHMARVAWCEWISISVSVVVYSVDFLLWTKILWTKINFSCYLYSYFITPTTMEPSVRDRNKCLLQWIQSLPPFSEEGLVPTNEHFKDGMMTSRILKRTIDPAYFTDLKDGPKEFTELVNVVKKMKEYISAHQVSLHIAISYQFYLTINTKFVLRIALACGMVASRLQKFN